MTASERVDQWLRDAAAPFEGWDFAYLKGRFVEGEPPRSYPALAKAAVGRAFNILDAATGGRGSSPPWRHSPGGPAP